MPDVSVSVGSPTQIAVTVAGSTGGNAVVTNGSVATVTVTNTGDRGPKGDPGSVNLSDATPTALGTAAAGSSSTAARADHVHPTLTAFPYSGLTGVPSTFTPASHTHTASQITDFATQAAKYGPVTSVNGQTGAVTVSASGTYTLPTATDTVLGGIKVGSGLSISSGVLSAAGTSYTLPTASNTVLGGVKIGSGLSITSGVLSASGSSYSLPTASDTVLGGVKVGAGLSISGGVLSATGGGIGAADTVDGGDYVGVIATLSFSQQPADVSISIDQGSTGSASFTVAASASTGAAVSYQWQVNTGSAWATVDGATSATLSLTGLTGTDDGNLYRCLVSAYGLPITASDSATLSVAVIVPSAPVISVSTQPQNATIQNTSSTASYSVTASVTSGTLAYQWQRRASGSTTWVNVTGGTSSTLSLSGLTYTANQGDSYRCRLSASGASTVITSTATLTITWVTAPQISVLNGPSTINWPVQNNFCVVTYGETLLGSPTTVSRQWQALNSSGAFVPISNILPSSQLPYGSTTRDLTLYQTTRAITVQCVIVATNAYGTATATTGQVLVNPAPIV